MIFRKKRNRARPFRSALERNNRIEDSMDEDSLETIEVTTCPYCGAKLMIFDSKTKICGRCGKRF